MGAAMPRTSPEPAAEPAGAPYDPLAWEARVASARARRAASLASRKPLQDPPAAAPEREPGPAPEAVAASAPTSGPTSGPIPVPPVVPAPARRRSQLGTALLVLAGVFLGGLGIGLGAALVMTGPIQLRQETLAEVAPAAQPVTPVATLLPEATPPAAAPDPQPDPQPEPQPGQPQPVAAVPPDTAPETSPAAAPEAAPAPIAAAPSEPGPTLAAEPAPLPAPVAPSVAEATPPAEAPGDPPAESLAAVDSTARAAEPPALETAAAADPEPLASLAVIAPRPRPAAPPFEAAAGTAPDTALGPDGAPLIGPPPPPAVPGPVATVRIHAPVNLSRAEVDRAIAALRAQGHRIEGPFRVSFSISRSNARYFHGGDAEAARAVSGALGPSARGTTVETRDFTHFAPRPPAGTVELWLAGRGSGLQTAPVAANRRPPNPIEALGRQIARIFNPNR
jgi:hypothetical protein